MCRHFELFRMVSGTELPTISLETEDDPTVARITLAVSNARTRTMLERAARVLRRHDASVVRAHLDVARDRDAGRVTFIAFIAQWTTGTRIESDDPRWLRLREELLRVKWLDFRVIEFVERHPTFTVPEGNRWQPLPIWFATCWCRRIPWRLPANASLMHSRYTPH